VLTRDESIRLLHTIGASEPLFDAAQLALSLIESGQLSDFDCVGTDSVPKDFPEIYEFRAQSLGERGFQTLGFPESIAKARAYRGSILLPAFKSEHWSVVLVTSATAPYELIGCMVALRNKSNYSAVQNRLSVRITQAR